MICSFKPTKSPITKAATIEKRFTAPERAVRPEEIFWSPISVGPYIVPVSRWIE